MIIFGRIFERLDPTPPTPPQCSPNVLLVTSYIYSIKDNSSREFEQLGSSFFPFETSWGLIMLMPPGGNPWSLALGPPSPRVIVGTLVGKLELI